jgi:hypothetical protein
MTTTVEEQTIGSSTRTSTRPIDETIEHLRETLGEIELGVLTSYTLADAIREGSSVTGQKTGGWGDGHSACALTAGYIAAKARNYV